jgi:hypothetical protein
MEAVLEIPPETASRAPQPKHDWKTLDANEAVARVAYALNEVIAIYPITPASPMGNGPMPGPLPEGKISGAIEREMWEWMEEHEYDSVEQLNAA